MLISHSKMSFYTAQNSDGTNPEKFHFGNAQNVGNAFCLM